MLLLQYKFAYELINVFIETDTCIPFVLTAYFQILLDMIAYFIKWSPIKEETGNLTRSRRLFIINKLF